MLIQGIPHRTLEVNHWPEGSVRIIDQRFLPHQIVWEDLTTCEQMRLAILDMHLRGAPLIGVAAAWGMALACRDLLADKSVQSFSLQEELSKYRDALQATRPTAINLHWALERQWKVFLAWEEQAGSKEQLLQLLGEEAQNIADEDVANCHRMGQNGLQRLRQIWEQKQKEQGNDAVLNILTHCNAGWLACVDIGTATAPIYAAHEAGIPVHVWVDETRPRNQGAKLTAWELGQQGVPHALIADNTGGHLMQHHQVDLVIVGADRVTRQGDVANKIGTYLKALAAQDNGIPFFVAFPFSTLDMSLTDGIAQIPIEERSPDEVRYMDGLYGQNIQEILLCPQDTPAVNYGFDVTPARLISALITEKGVCAATELGIERLCREQVPPTEADDSPEGVIKFQCRWNERFWNAAELEREALWLALFKGRHSMVQSGLLGVGEDGIGFGNLSIRDSEDPQSFWITGSQTGLFSDLGAEGYARVVSLDIEQNSLDCEGPVKASSESLSHGMFYGLSSQIGAVAHGHHRALWKRLLETGAPGTSASVAYGTPAMAYALEQVWKETGQQDQGFMVMEGHEDGIIAWGPDPESVAGRLVALLRGFGLLPRGMGEILMPPEKDFY